MPERRQPRGVTHVRGQGQAAERARLRRRRNSREDLPKSQVRGGRQEELPYAPRPEARSGGREDQPHIQGALAAWTQEGLEELSHIEGQEGRR